MTTDVDVEQIETTKGEKLLAVVLAVFLLTGLLWTYFNVDVEPAQQDYAAPFCYEDCDPYLDEPQRAKLVSPADNAALAAASRARQRLDRASSIVGQRRGTVTDRRETYRTALDEGRRDSTLERQYRTAQARYSARTARSHECRTRKRRGTASGRRPAPAAARCRAPDGAARRSAAAPRWARQRRSALGASARLARRRLRPARLSAAAPVALHRHGDVRCRGAVAALALVMAVDYLTDYVEFTDQGVLALSAGGVALTLVAFWWLQRYLARRLPERRVRKGECPFCGYPVRGEHCESCGRDTVAACADVRRAAARRDAGAAAPAARRRRPTSAPRDRTAPPPRTTAVELDRRALLRLGVRGAAAGLLVPAAVRSRARPAAALAARGSRS